MRAAYRWPSYTNNASRLSTSSSRVSSRIMAVLMAVAEAVEEVAWADQVLTWVATIKVEADLSEVASISLTTITEVVLDLIEAVVAGSTTSEAA